LGNKTVANSEEHINFRCLAKFESVLRYPDEQTAHNVDQQNKHASDRITADKLRGTVHGAEKIGLLRDFFSSLKGSFLIDHAGIQIGIDCHLLTRQRVESETRDNLGGSACTLGHNDEIDDHQNDKNDEADDVIAGDDELAKRGDDISCRVGAFVTTQEHYASRGYIKAQAKHCG